MDHSQMEHVRLPDGSMVMIMDGLPGWAFGVAIAVIMLLSFVVVEWKGLPDVSGWRLNLTAPRWLHRAMRQRWFQPLLRLPIILMFVGTLYAGLFGSQLKNIAPVMVWTIWWAALIFAVAMFGNAWCVICPWDGIANLVNRLGGVFRKKATLSLKLNYPDWLKNVYPAIGLFIGLTWLELAVGVTNKPSATATMGVAMAAAAVAFALLFEKKVFCEYFCFVGRITGMYSMFSPIEVRPRDSRVCDVCTSRACLTGNGQGYACPTNIDLGELKTNENCTGCTECFKSCPSLAPAVRVRTFNQGFHKAVRADEGRMDSAWLALSLLALTGFHGLTMTPVWQNFSPGTWDIMDALQTTTGLGRLGAYTLGMTAALALPAGVYAGATWASWQLTGKKLSFKRMFTANAWAVLPVALFYHLAHNAMHLFMEGPDIWPLLSDPMGRGWDVFGGAESHPSALLGQGGTWLVQVVLICIGHIAGVVTSHRIAKKLFTEKRDAVRSLLPMLVLMILLSICGLWLMHLDMNMRMGRM
jgi:polyferredoxin